MIKDTEALVLQKAENLGLKFIPNTPYDPRVPDVKCDYLNYRVDNLLESHKLRTFHYYCRYHNKELENAFERCANCDKATAFTNIWLLEARVDFLENRSEKIRS